MNVDVDVFDGPEIADVVDVGLVVVFFERKVCGHIDGCFYDLKI